MFSKNKIPESTGDSADITLPIESGAKKDSPPPPIPSTPKGKVAASVISSDLKITGNLQTTGDIQVEGTVEGDIRAHLLTVGESATVRGEVIADDVVVNGHVIGCLRGLKVRLTSTARVEGDIIHKTIAIESGAHFEGSVKRQEDPLSKSKIA